jgi:peptidyl-prolyl cis-trans isomerase SurA
MIMTTTFFDRLSAVILGCATALILSGSPSHAQTVAVMVNGEPITNYDIDQRSKLITLSTHKPADRQQVINELIDEKVKLKEGKKFAIDPSAADIDQSYTAMSARMRISAEQLTKSLESQGIRPDTLKARMKAEMVWSNLVRGRFKESLQIGEKDVEHAVQNTGEEKAATQSFEYKMPRSASP